MKFKLKFEIVFDNIDLKDVSEAVMIEEALTHYLCIFKTCDCKLIEIDTKSTTENTPSKPPNRFEVLAGGKNIP